MYNLPTNLQTRPGSPVDSAPSTSSFASSAGAFRRGQLENLERTLISEQQQRTQQQLQSQHIPGSSGSAAPLTLGLLPAADQQFSTGAKRSRVGSLARIPSHNNLRTTGGGSGGSTPRSVTPGLGGQWSSVEERQKDFEHCLIRMTANNGWAFTWVENPETLNFFSKFCVGLVVPKRRKLSTSILKTELDLARGYTLDRVRGCLVTVQSDGWTGGNNHHFQAFMLTGDKQVRLLKV
jgi:hypothetical protein